MFGSIFRRRRNVAAPLFSAVLLLAALLLAAPAHLQHWYRVTWKGFHVKNQTWDHALSLCL